MRKSTKGFRRVQSACTRFAVRLIRKKGRTPGVRRRGLLVAPKWNAGAARSRAPRADQNLLRQQDWFRTVSGAASAGANLLVGVIILTTGGQFHSWIGPLVIGTVSLATALLLHLNSK